MTSTNLDVELLTQLKYDVNLELQQALSTAINLASQPGSPKVARKAQDIVDTLQALDRSIDTLESMYPLNFVGSIPDRVAYYLLNAEKPMETEEDVQELIHELELAHIPIDKTIDPNVIWTFLNPLTTHLVKITED